MRSMLPAARSRVSVPSWRQCSPVPLAATSRIMNAQCRNRGAMTWVTPRALWSIVQRALQSWARGQRVPDERDVYLEEVGKSRLG